MYLQDLSNVHSGRNAQRVQHDLQWSSVVQERHILFRQDPGDDAFVPVTSRHLISYLDLSLGSDIDSDCLGYSRRQLVFVFPGEDLHVNDDSLLTVRYLQGGVSDLSGLFAEDCSEKLLF